MWICLGLLWSCYTLECYLCVSYCSLEPKASITFLELIVTYSGSDGIVWRSQKRSQTCLVWVCYTRSVHKDESHLDHCWNSVCYIYSVFLLWNFQVKEQITVGRKHPHIRGLQTTSSRNWLMQSGRDPHQKSCIFAKQCLPWVRLPSKRTYSNRDDINSGFYSTGRNQLGKLMAGLAVFLPHSRHLDSMGRTSVSWKWLTSGP